MLKHAMTNKIKTKVILKKYKKDMLFNDFDFDKMDLMNYKNTERCMNAQVLMADKATQRLNKEKQGNTNRPTI